MFCRYFCSFICLSSQKTFAVDNDDTDVSKIIMIIIIAVIKQKKIPLQSRVDDDGDDDNGGYTHPVKLGAR